ncbi:hypothetical protein B0H13DRAFT_1915886 [Mycena leptocephala]|nr:hypothetical protein B0H13DRAFT_1915886 [Mycena leptocephala]
MSKHPTTCASPKNPTSSSLTKARKQENSEVPTTTSPSPTQRGSRSQSSGVGTCPGGKEFEGAAKRMKDKNMGYISEDNDYRHRILYVGEEWDATGSKTKAHGVNGGGNAADWQTATRYPYRALRNRAGKAASTGDVGQTWEGLLRLQPNLSVQWARRPAPSGQRQRTRSGEGRGCSFGSRSESRLRHGMKLHLPRNGNVPGTLSGPPGDLPHSPPLVRKLFLSPSAGVLSEPPHQTYCVKFCSALFSYIVWNE